MLACKRMRRLAVGSTLLTVAALMGSAGSASAEGIRAAALAPQLKGVASTPELRDKFHEAVLKGLQGLAAGSESEVLSGAETRSRLGEDLLGCSGQAPCLPRATSALRANRVVATEITVAGKSYTIALRLYDGQGRELTHADDLCEICTVREADEAVTKAAARLAAVARTFPVEPTAEREREKPRTAEKSRPTPAPPPPPPTPSPMQEPPARTAAPVVKEQHRFPWRPLAFTSLAIGIVGLAAGIPLIVIDGRPTCDAPDPVHQCKEVYNTLAGGATLAALGGLGLVASIPLFYFDSRDRRQKVTALRVIGVPAVGGGALALAGRF